MEVSRPQNEERKGSLVSYSNSEYSSGRFSTHVDSLTVPNFAESGGRVSSSYGPGGQRQTEMKLLAAGIDDSHPPERKEDYKGRIRTWPGVLIILLIIGGALAAITLEAVNKNELEAISEENYENRLANKRKIKDGLDDDQVIISDDGQVGNPKKYPDMGCELPDYQSKDGQIFAVSKNGTEVPVGIKGVNWFGMETGLAIPFGLWENMDNGTSVYEIAAFLARNKYNSVRLPVCIKNILKNTAPSKDLINVNTNRAINITSYMTTIQTIVEALGYRHITVMISLHTLDPKKSGGVWYSDELDVTEDQFLEANAGAYPVDLNIESKLVWAPHYYNTGVSPAWYLYGGGTQGEEGALLGYVELDDDTLRNNVEKTMDAMFGYLLTDTSHAMVMGEFAGLYAKDKHPMLTTKRTTDFTIEAMLKAGYAGGYMWSLNPESAYQFNPADTYGHFTEGLLEDDWLTPNKVFMEGMAALDGIKDLKMFPCFPQKEED
ncbi:hypothetical protein JM16_003702 [Phytophthora kernoviae]|uniref:Glycoside hydrolase family 5 domain-containing protein n=1 Tax=Phytophthora kernoviae TaxID=325452 RepID=A0A8T0M2L1_9STRA|nr:hypothetical protein JM16_003702 [Phytophthora kernoviae]